MSRRTSFALALSTLCLPTAALAAPGDIDNTFGVGGSRIVDIQIASDVRNNSATHVLIQSDGKIVLGGAAQDIAASSDTTQRMVAVRLTASGGLDGSFGNGGIVRVDGLPGRDDEQYYDGRLGFAPNGNIYLYLGTQDASPEETIGWATARLTLANGSLDNGWDGDGLLSASTNDGIAGDIVVQEDGKVLILDDYSNAGDQDMRVCRFTSTGAPDGDFGDAGCRTVAFDLGTTQNDFARVMILHPDGRIVIAGQARSSSTAADDAIAILTAEGDLDGSFGGGDGKVTVSFDLALGNMDEVRALGVDAKGRIYAGGVSGSATTTNNQDASLVRLLPDGTPDPDFGGGDGKVTFYFANSANGSFDQIFGLVVQGDGKVVVAGRGTSAAGGGRRAGVARFTESGEFDSTFAVGGKTVFDPGGNGTTVGRAIAMAENGYLVVSGFTLEADNDFFATRLENDYVFADGFEWGDSAWILSEP